MRRNAAWLESVPTQTEPGDTSLQGHHSIIIDNETQQTYALFLNDYKLEAHEQERQKADIEKIFAWMRRSVSENYLTTCVSVTHDWVKVYNNLKEQVGQGSREIQWRIRDDYQQHMKLFIRMPRDPEAQIVKWEKLMIDGRKKSMPFAIDIEDQSSRFLEAIRPLDDAWVTSFEQNIDLKIDEKNLIFKDLSNGYRKLISRNYNKQ